MAGNNACAGRRGSRERGLGRKFYWAAWALAAWMTAGLTEVLPLAGAQDEERLQQAMAYRPTQAGVEYDRPSPEEMAGLRLENASVIGQTGFVVRDAGQRILRRFVDSTGNRKIDTWAYYQNGIEVYRDIDTSGNVKPDRYQWLGPLGTRIGIDTNEDLKIDRWERLSAQELTQLVVEALAAGSPDRLRALLLTQEELSELKLEPVVADRIAGRLQQTRRQLEQEWDRSRWPESLKWLHFTASIPGALPVVDGVGQDQTAPPVASGGAVANGTIVEVHDHVSAIVELGDQTQQLLVGSLLRVGESWRMIDFPQMADQAELAAIGGVFFQASGEAGSGASEAIASTEGLNPDLLNAYQAAEEALRDAMGTRSGPALAVLHQRRAQALWKIVLDAAGSARDPWLRQYADVVSSAYQIDEFPGGLELLAKQIAEMKQSRFDPESIAYAEFRHLNAWYSRATEQPEDLDVIQEQWQGRLQDFVQRYPKSLMAAEAMFQLANIDDYLGDAEAAEKTYRRIVDDFPNAPLARRARGAVIRLTSVGKAVPFRGSTVNQQPFTLEQLKGKTVLIHFWATWCEPCKAEFNDLRDLRTKYGPAGFEIVSVSLDEDRQTVLNYLSENRLPWTHLYEEGGLEGSPLAAQLGVIALPTMVLIGPDGKVVERGLSMPQLERELRKLDR